MNSTEQLRQVLNQNFTLRAVLELMSNRPNLMENSQMLLDYAEFKLRPYENTIDILAIGNNEDKYIGTINGRNINDILRLTF